MTSKIVKKYGPANTRTHVSEHAHLISELRVYEVNGVTHVAEGGGGRKQAHLELFAQVRAGRVTLARVQLSNPQTQS